MLIRSFRFTVIFSMLLCASCGVENAAKDKAEEDRSCTVPKVTDWKQKTTRDVNGKMTSKAVAELDANGLATKRSYYDATEKLTEEEKITWNVDGRIAKQEWFAGSSTTLKANSVDTYAYDSPLGKMTVTSDYYGGKTEIQDQTVRVMDDIFSGEFPGLFRSMTSKVRSGNELKLEWEELNTCTARDSTMECASKRTAAEGGTVLMKSDSRLVVTDVCRAGKKVKIWNAASDKYQALDESGKVVSKSETESQWNESLETTYTKDTETNELGKTTITETKFVLSAEGTYPISSKQYTDGVLKSETTYEY